MIVIVGTGRCGTQYAATFFQQVFELDVKHEAFGKDGIAAYYMLMQKHREINKDKLGPDAVILHQVREPMKVISSLMKRDIITESPLHIPEIKESDDRLVKCAKYYYYWNKRADIFYNIDLRYKVEDMQKGTFIQDLCKVLNISFKPEMVKKAKAINTRINTSYFPSGEPDENYISSTRKITTKRYNLQDIQDLDKNTYDLIVKMAMEYGYHNLTMKGA